MALTREKLKSFIDVLLGHDLFRVVVLVMVTLRTSAILNPYVGPFVKFTIVWAVLILVRDLFKERLFLVNRYRLILYLFLIGYGITTLIHREENFARNVAMLGYLCVNLLVMYAYDPRRAPGEIKLQLMRFSHVFLITAFVGQLISLVTFVLNVSFTYTVNDTLYYYGIYEGRLWGFYSNPNAASFYAVLCLMLTVLCGMIRRGNTPKGWRIFYWVNMIVEALVFFLCNSRTSIIAACGFLVLFPLLTAIPDIVRCAAKMERGGLIRRTAAFCIIVPLALLGTYEYAIDILPNFVWQNNPISSRLSDELSEIAGEPGSSAVAGGVESSEDLARSNYGSALGGRYYLWKAGAEIVRNDPLFGVGNDNVPVHAYRYAARYHTNFGDPVYLPGVTGGLHNLFVQIAAASGLVGLGLFLLFGILVLIRAARYYIWMVKNGRVNQLAILCLCIVLVIILRTMTDTGILYGLYYLGVIFWAALSALMYFMETEFPCKHRSAGAFIENLIFGRGRDKGIPELKLKPRRRFGIFPLKK